MKSAFDRFGLISKLAAVSGAMRAHCRCRLAAACAACAAAGLLAAACDVGHTPAWDILGADETVVEAIPAELVSDKHPQFDPELTLVEEFDGCSLTLNKSAAVTRLTITDEKSGLAELDGMIFPTRGAALAALGSRAMIPSMEVVNGALKPFNDGLYAAIELAVEDGSDGSRVNKRATFDALLAAMLNAAAHGEADAPVAAVHFAAASILTGASPLLPAAIEQSANSSRESFEEDVFHATPIGFYTWTPELSSIFKRDRFLQQALLPGRAGFRPAVALARALAAADELAIGYRNILELYRGLTNPSHDFDALALLQSAAIRPDADLGAAESEFAQLHPELDLDPACQAGFSWLPASDSPERKLIAGAYCNGQPPANLLNALIAAISSGEIDLTPSATSGWYDYQLYALETLLLPERGRESEHLLLTQKYKDKLVETFKSLLIQTRETHVKQLGTVARTGSAKLPTRKVDVYPMLPIEPFPTFYLRTARGYAFLRNVLAAAVGRAVLTTTSRLREDGSRESLSLDAELAQKSALLYGLHRLAAASIGMRDELTADELDAVDPAFAEETARSWLSNWQADRDVLSDPRVAVPLVADAEAGVTRNLAVVGVKVVRMSASFPAGHEPQVRPAPSFPVCGVRHFVPFEPYMLVEQSLEFERSLALPPLTGDQLRAALNGHTSLEAIRAALETL